MNKELNCKKCNSKSHAERYVINVDGLDFITILCDDCKTKFDKYMINKFKEYGLEPDEDFLWDDDNE